MSLIEIMVALALVVTFFAPVVAMLSVGTTKAYRGGDRTVATIYAADIIEVIRGAPFDAFLPNGQPMTLRQVLMEHNIQKGFQLERYNERFSVEAVVSAVGEYPPSLIKKISVTVSWKGRVKKEGKAVPRSLTLTTFYTPTK